VRVCSTSVAEYCYGAGVVSTIGQRELRNDGARIIDAVAAGQTFVVTRHGTPVAELRPVQDRRPRFVSRNALVSAIATGPHLKAARFRADLDEALDQAR
jgi:prevent-host-death family protein